MWLQALEARHILRGLNSTPSSPQGPSQAKSWFKVLKEDSGVGPSSELWDSPHLKGLFHFSPVSLSRNWVSAGKVRVISARSLITLPMVSGLLGKGMKLRKIKAPGQPLAAPVPDK